MERRCPSSCWVRAAVRPVARGEREVIIGQGQPPPREMTPRPRSQAVDHPLQRGAGGLEDAGRPGAGRDGPASCADDDAGDLVAERRRPNAPTGGAP